MLHPAYHKKLIEAGIDEAGRGCFAGPVVAAAVILDKSYRNPMLNDSKQLSAKQREGMRQIIEKEAISHAVAIIDVPVIDEINILNATYKAMNQAVNSLKLKPQLLLVDGNRFKNETGIKNICIIKGDEKYLSIAAASILAKTYRDEYMRVLDRQYPHYGWSKNKGYPTPGHKEAIARYGITEYHRKSFNLNEQLKLFH
jgi:ribonuclease HII